MSLPPFLAAGLTLSLVLLGIVAYFSYRWLVQRLQSATKPEDIVVDPEQPSTSQQESERCTSPAVEQHLNDSQSGDGNEPLKSPTGTSFIYRCTTFLKLKQKEGVANLFFR